MGRFLKRRTLPKATNTEVRQTYALLLPKQFPLFENWKLIRHNAGGRFFKKNKNMDRFIKLHDLIIDWGNSKGIQKKSTPLKQLTKTLEECNELLKHLTDIPHDREAIQDDLYDIVVTLILYCDMKNYSFLSFWNDGSDDNIDTNEEGYINQGIEILMALSRHMRNEVCDFRFKSNLNIMIFYIKSLSKAFDINPTEGLESVYNVISKRTGKMVNGVFVKDE